MIEDKEMDLKMAENKEEAYWLEIKKSTEEDIERLEKLLKFQKSVLKMCEEQASNALQNT